MNTVRMDTVLHDSYTVTPNLVIDFSIIDQTYDRFVKAFPGGKVFYAVKANASMDILRLVADRGGGFEIASVAELDRSLDAGAAPGQIICSNPIKNLFFLEQMHAYGVYAMVVDSTYEVEKVARCAPGSQVYVRLAVDNTGSVLPLAGKFGVAGDEALALFDYAHDLGLCPIGLSFHVGSQCLSVRNWANAIAACGVIWRQAEARGHRFHFLDIGGGFPVGHYHNPAIPTIEAVGEVVMAAVRQHIPRPDDLLLVLEPGRGLVGESGRLLTSVVGKAQRGADTWLYLDAGVFNGLMETYEGFPPVVHLLAAGDADRPQRRYTLAGPSCDSCDVIARDLSLPEVHIGDRLVFYDAGAYTNEYAVPFNGFPIPVLTMLPVEQPVEAVPG
jgi:ornithine decarboxylase